MASCEPYQAQLLSYLYDLLEADEQRSLREHLEQCGACQAALTRAQSQKKLLAAAAKAAFPAVRFQPPAAGEVVGEAETPAVRLQTPRGAWLSWAIAASVLLLISLGVPATVWTWRYSVAQEHAQALAEEYQAKKAQAFRLRDEHQATLVRTQHEVSDLQERMHKLVEGQQEKWAALQKAARDRQMNVVVSGPQTVQPGAPNQYQVVTRSPNNQPVPSRLDIRVRNEKKEVIYEQKDIDSKGNSHVSLPANLPVDAGGKLSLEIVARREGGRAEQIREELSLAAPVYLTHLTTDKPMYRPGETVHFRSLTLERFSLKPAKEDLQLLYTVTKPTGEDTPVLAGSPLLFDEKTQSPLLGPDKKPVRGIGAGEFTLDPEARGGEYTLTVRETANRFAQQQRKFIVNQYENPRLNKELDFTRKSYGPGDDVVAACKVSRVEGGASVANQPVIATIQIDGKSYGRDGKEGAKQLSFHTDQKGAVNVPFKLPKVIERGQASLSVQFYDGPSPETLVRSIPIVVKKLQVEFFPEGGDLVAGVPNRVYFQARTMLDKPAELKGRIVDQDGKAVVDNVQTLNDDKEPGVNQGMGLFALTPQAGRKYELKIDAPSGIEGQYKLPALKEDGVALSIPTGTTDPKEPIRVVLHSGQKDRTLLVGAYCRGRLMDHQSVTAKKGEPTTVDLRPAQEVGGVYRVTVFEELGVARPESAKGVADSQPGRSRTQGLPPGVHQQLLPVAERLVYRKPAEQLILTVKPDRKQYVPGDKVKLSVSALDEKEQPAPAILLVAVVDKSVVTLADEKTFRSMPTHYYLTTEVRRPEDLEYADVLVGAHPKSAAALDLLLGTQGWRRFAEQNPGKFRQQFKEDADRLLVTIGQSSQKSVDLAQHEIERLQIEFNTELAKLQEQQAKAHEAWLIAGSGKDFTPKMEALRKELAQLKEMQSQAAGRIDQQRAFIDEARSVVLALGVIVVLAAPVLSVIAIRRGLPRAIPYYALTAVCALLVVGVVSLLTEDRPGLGNRGAVAGDQDDLQIAKLPISVDEVFKMRGEVGKFDPADARVGDLLNFDPAKMKEAHGRLGGVAGDNQLAEPGLPKGAAAVPEADKRLDGAFFAYKANRGLDERKKAPELRRQAAADMLAKDRGAGLRRAKDFKNADGKAEVAEKEVAARKLLQANGRLMMPPRGGRGFGGGGLGFGGGFNGGFGAFQGEMPQLPGGFGGNEDAKRPPGQPWFARGEQSRTPPPQPLMVREYAHQRPTSTPAEVRSDFVDTVYWHPVLVLPDGKADVSFDLCDAVTTFQVAAVGHTVDGRLSTVTSTLEARLPFALEPKLPIEVTASDKIDVPVSIANNTSDPRQVRIHLTPTGLNLLQGQNDEQLTVKADERTRRLFRFQPALVEGQAGLLIDGQSTPFTDRVTRSFQVVPEGFPVVGSRSDVLEKVAHDDVVLPETWVKGTLKCQVQVYPSTLADLQKGLESLLREPCGCFEQTSTSNYPNLLILDYIKESDQPKPEVERRARDLLAKGYQKLTSFECLEPSQNKRQGYEWFGGTAPAHEALTAYGLLQFRDMARVFDVDPNMIERTRQYLMSRKDGKGGFQRNPRALDTFGRAPDDITNAYIIWALTESGKDDDVEKELAALAAQAKTSKDPYFLSLVATSLINRGNAGDGSALLKTVGAAQKEDGHLDAARTSITGSGGRDLQIETTALAVLGWLKANRPADFNANLQKAVKWIGQQRGGYGGFGSTQSTILALKALIGFTKANKKTPESGELRLYAGEQPMAHLNFPAAVQDALVLNLPEPEKHLKPGKNSLRVEITGKNTFPYTLTWSYQTLKPASAEKCPVRLNTRLDRETADEGETVHLSVTVENATDKGQGMAVAIIGLPAGLTLPEDMKQLKDHARLRNDGKEKGLISAWETRGREVILYWRDLAPKQKIEVPLDLICRVPGEYSGPASRAYLYYNADLKHWVEPLKTMIKAKTE